MLLVVRKQARFHQLWKFIDLQFKIAEIIFLWLGLDHKSKKNESWVRNKILESLRNVLKIQIYFYFLNNLLLILKMVLKILWINMINTDVIYEIENVIIYSMWNLVFLWNFLTIKPGSKAINAIPQSLMITENVKSSSNELSCDKMQPVWQHIKLYGMRPEIQSKNRWWVVK